MIELNAVTKTYGETTVVDSVTTTIPAGGLTSIIGPNGAGKSTLLGLISRLLPMDGGSVSVGGLDVAGTPSKTLARTLSILRQENQVSLRLRVRDLVTFGRFPHTGGRPTSEDRVHVEAALAHLDLTELADRYLDELSGGQRQRAFIAMVLAQDTDYILLDEPLNNLDMKHSVEMMRLMRGLADEAGKTVVVVLHDINFASSYSDTILAMRQGALTAQGSPDQIMRTEVLSQIYDLEIPIHEVAGKRIGVYFS
ncbi:iron ABC transporter ATP-binding protein [Galactobacter caseinivorans]|uniref:ATP-binding cassette domain-containing protein n=1 Tax=Galactobacter caseinivorans TaxID=2676123 RepID=A0A496PIA7_9MICC|nr:ATP-binding cassette domain-containing protein [Galactobacter caseinivorans]RKW70190.1 ATP-binding cassette domain-containing protein [Galactobacter caseinivorans]